jgi:hypothetical protein
MLARADHARHGICRLCHNISTDTPPKRKEEE